MFSVGVNGFSCAKNFGLRFQFLDVGERGLRFCFQCFVAFLDQRQLVQCGIA